MNFVKIILMNNLIKKINDSFLLVLLLLVATYLNMANAQKTILKGTVNQSTKLDQGLNRSDLNSTFGNYPNPNNDSFGSFNASNASNSNQCFNPANTVVPNNKGTPSFGTQLDKLESQLQNFENSSNFVNPKYESGIENSPQMKLAWDNWHKRVASEVFQRFQVMTKMAFNNGEPLEAFVSYIVTSDGHIHNVKIDKASNNPKFDKMLTMVVNSLDGEVQILKFPYGSKRKFVEKGGMFTQNSGEQGFRYTTGDSENLK